MSAYAIPHFTKALLTEGGIDSRRHPVLFDELISERERVGEALETLGMELVLNTSAGIAIARNMSEAKLAAMSEDLDCAPISPVWSFRRLTFWESCAVVFFRRQLEQEELQGGREILMRQEQVLDALSADYHEALLTDGARAEARLQQTLANLLKIGLVEKHSPRSSSPSWRGSKLLLVAISRDELDGFEDRMREALARHDAPDAADDDEVSNPDDLETNEPDADGDDE